jgi:phospholipid transport system substrate-binding protein
MSLNGIRVLLALFAFSVAAPQVHAATPQVPDITPNEFITEAVKVLAKKLDGRRSELADDPEALYALIDEVLLPRFDRKGAARAVLAKHSRSASEEQFTRFIDAFYSSLVQKYAIGVLDFEPDRIKVIPYRGEVTRRVVTVKTTVDLEDGTNIKVSYGLTHEESIWKIFDVIIEGVSYIRSFRTEFDAEITAIGLEKVIVRLEAEAMGGDSEEAEAVEEVSEEAEAAGDGSE